MLLNEGTDILGKIWLIQEPMQMSFYSTEKYVILNIPLMSDLV